MSTPIRIKRRTAPGSAGAPPSLYQAELAFNEVDRTLYYGYGNAGGLTAASIIAIGGDGQFVTIGTAQTITGQKTFTGGISATLSNSLTIGAGLSQNGSTYNGSANQTISLPYIGTPGTYGSTTAIPVITTDVYGRVSGLGTTSISTTISLVGNTGTGSVAGGGTLAIAGGTGITTSVTGSGVTVSIDGTVVTLSGTQTLTNKTLTSPVISTIVNTGTLTLPTSTDTLVGVTTSATLTNKSFDTAGTGNTFKINGNQITSYTGSGVTVVLQNSPTINAPVISTIVNTGTLTLPTSTDTLVARNTSDTLTNKTINSTSNTIQLNGNQIIGYTGTGSTVVLVNSPTLVTPNIGAATAASINNVVITSGTGATLTIANGKTLTASNTLTFTGTDGSTVAFGAGGTVLYLNGTIGTPSSGTLTNCVGLPVSTGIAGLGTNVATFLATPSAANLASAVVGTTGTAGNLVFSNSPVLTSPSFSTIVNVGTLTLPTSTDTLVGVGTTATFTNKSFDTAGTGNTFKINGNQITAVTGSGVTVVLQNSPTINAPVISTIVNTGTLTLPTSTDTLVARNTSDTLTNKTINSANNTIQLNGNQIIGYTGTGNSVVLSNSPTLTSPTLGNATATSITGSTGNFTITAAAGNNGVYLVPTGTGTVDVGSTRITSVATPLVATDAVNKAYADAIASSLNIHNSVQAATASPVSYAYVGGGTSQTITTIASNTLTFSANHNLQINSQVRSNNTTNGFTTGTTYYVITIPSPNQVTLSTTPGGSTQTFTAGSSLSISVTTDQGVGAQLTGTGQTVDGYNVQSNDRILVKDHTNSAYNGIYTVTTVGTGSNGVWTRSTDYDNLPTGEIVAGDFVFVGNGTSNGRTGFVETANGPIIVGTSPITFTQFSAAGTFVAGTGISIAGNNISISPTYSGQSSITTVGTINSGTWNGSIIGPTYGGTGVNNGSNTITIGGNVNLASSFTTSGSFPITLYATAGTGVTLPTTGTLATLANTETFTNKTLSTNSTWNGNVITPTYGGTGVNNGSNTITLGGYVSTGGSFITSGAFPITLYATAGTGITLPTTGTLATLANTETLSNKTLVAPALSAETFSTTNNVTAGTNSQGSGALTSDYNVITTASNNPSGVTLPTATTGRKIVIVNKGANPVNVYPVSGGQIDALGANNPISIPVNGWMEFNASSTSQWYSSYNATFNPSVVNGGTGVTATPTNGQLLIGNGTGYTLNTLGAGTGITVSNGSGSISISNAGVTSLSTSGNGISINGSTGALTISTGATSANTASTIVYRDTSGNFSAGAVTASSLTLSTALTVPNGGTGVTTFTSKGILYGNGSGSILVTVAAGTGDSTTTNQILTVDGNGNPVWASSIDGGSF